MPAKLRQAFRGIVTASIPVIEDAIGKLGGHQAGAADTLRRLAHQLRASGTSHGFPDVTAAATKLQQASADDVKRDAAALLDVLRGVIAAIPAQVRTVLVVDDDPMVTMLLSKALAGDDRTVAVASNWTDAESQLRTLRPSLIVLDIMLPDTDGRNALIWLREQAHTATIPIFILSGGAGGSVPVAECLALGATRYIEKPFSPKDVASAADAALRESDMQSWLDGFVQAQRAPAATPDEVAPDATARETPVVLLAEDDPLVSMLVRDRLKRAGMEVVHVEDGRKALDAARQQQFSCAILDVKLPALDGFALLAELRKDPRHARLPVAMLTAMGQEKDVMRGFELGADDYIVKPFSPRELAARIQRLVDRGAGRTK
jgi:two-component system response regulator MtrA